MVPAQQAPAAARAAADRSAWHEAYELLAGLGPGRLERHDLTLLADAAWWTSRLDESMATRRRAHAAHAAAGDARAAAHAAWFLSVDHGWKGEAAAASGWLRRAERHLAGLPECAEHGLVAVARADAARRARDLEGAAALAEAALGVGMRAGAQDVVAMALQTLGRVRIAEGRHEEGLPLLDEAMCAVLAGELTPLYTGWVFCTVLSACFERADLGRAGEWTIAAMAWCESLDTTTPFHGICRVHRVEVRALHGAWAEAEADGLLAEGELAELWPDLAAEALYAVGEVRRRRGDMEAAEEAFERAGTLGLDPQPGLALLRLDQGRPHAAEAALRLAGLGVGRSLLSRAGLLGARVEIALARADRAGAREAAAALGELAAEARAPVLAAAAAMADAAVRLAEGDAEGALRAAGEAWAGWQRLRLPHEAARARMLLGLASRAGGDEERARRELEAARAGFARLGAAPGERRAAALLARPAGPGGLSAREVEVLRLVAAGRTNRQVAAELVLSEHTVARHLQNAFGKIGVSSRAAAAAYAVEQGLV